MSLTSPATRAPGGALSLSPHRIAAWLLAGFAIYLLFFFGLTSAGVLGPDEPRYAAIGREMARSGDWVTPRLWGEPWFEKPALLYWMTGAAFRLGLGPDLAPRLPVALLSAAFLVLFYWMLRREFGSRAAFFSTAILATSAAWLAYSQVGVTDLPMAAAFSAAMLLTLGWIDRGETRFIPAAAALFGIAVLAKGLVPLVLALPLVWFGRKRLSDWLRPAPVIAFLLAAAPWYLLCFYRHGWAFFNDFFLKHHLSRFASDALRHQQPFWFYVPVLLAGLFPWTPLLATVLLKPGRPAGDSRRQFLIAWVLFGLLFFSASTNKLPGYLLPLVPAVAVLFGVALDGAKRAAAVLAPCALLLVAVPVIGQILPDAIARGISRTNPGALSWMLLLPPLAVAAAAWVAETRGRRTLAFCLVSGLMVVGAVWLKARSLPALDRAASARAFWKEISPRAREVCVERMHRSWRYNLNYYSVTPLPDCTDQPRRLRVAQESGRPPVLIAPAISSTP